MLKKRPLGKGINAVINENKKVEQPSYIEIPYPKEDTLNFADIFACIGLAFGFIALGMALK